MEREGKSITGSAHHPLDWDDRFRKSFVITRCLKITYRLGYVGEPISLSVFLPNDLLLSSNYFPLLAIFSEINSAGGLIS